MTKMKMMFKRNKTKMKANNQEVIIRMPSRKANSKKEKMKMTWMAMKEKVKMKKRRWLNLMRNR